MKKLSLLLLSVVFVLSLLMTPHSVLAASGELLPLPILPTLGGSSGNTSGEKYLFLNSGDLYVYDGTGAKTALTNTGGFINEADISPDKTKITYRYAGDIWLINADGSNVQRLTENGHVTSIAWSPDGTEIAYIYDFWQIRVLNLSTKEERVSYDKDTNLSNIYGLQWSPDGKEFMFQGQYSGQTSYDSDIFVADVSGDYFNKHATQLTNSPETEGGPVYSPSGTKIAYYAPNNGKYSNFVMNRDGSNATPVVTVDQYNDMSAPVWSEDGKSLMYTKRLDYYHSGLCQVSLDTKQETVILNNLPTYGVNFIGILQ